MVSVPWQIMNNARKKIRKIIPDAVDDNFFTYDYDTKQIVSNKKIYGHHYIFDSDGNLIKKHKD